jgi:hypothetical protein
MAKKPIGKAKLAPKTHGKIANISKGLVQQIMIDGLRQYTVEGVIEAKWKIAGIANLLLRLGNKIAAAEVANEAAQMDALLNSDTARAEVWQNLKEAIEPAESEESEDSDD